MRPVTEKTISSVCTRILQPLIKMLLKSGFTYNEFLSVARSAFVDVASGEFGSRGRPANVSRVAVITGMSRKAVKKERDLLEQQVHGTAAAEQLWSPAMRVLTGWHQDVDFLDDNGRPLKLPVNGADPSFATLLDRYCGDIPHNAMATELERVGAIDITSGIATVLQRSYVNSADRIEALDMVGTFLHDFSTTMEFNLERGSDDVAWFQRVAENTELKPGALRSLRRILTADGQELLERLDGWMSNHEVDETRDEQPVRAGVGIYFFQDASRTRSYKPTYSELTANKSRDVSHRADGRGARAGADQRGELR